MGDLPPSAFEPLTCGCGPAFWLGFVLGAAMLALAVTFVAWWLRR